MTPRVSAPMSGLCPKETCFKSAYLCFLSTKLLLTLVSSCWKSLFCECGSGIYQLNHFLTCCSCRLVFMFRLVRLVSFRLVNGKGHITIWAHFDKFVINGFCKFLHDSVGVHSFACWGEQSIITGRLLQIVFRY